MITLPAESTLIGLFECQPTVLDRDVPWCYNHLTFDTRRATDRVCVEIQPGYNEMRIVWEHEGVEVVNLTLNSVTEISAEVDGGREWLIATFRDPTLLPLRVQLKPRIHVLWGTSDDVHATRQGV